MSSGKEKLEKKKSGNKNTEGQSPLPSSTGSLIDDGSKGFSGPPRNDSPADSAKDVTTRPRREGLSVYGPEGSTAPFEKESRDSGTAGTTFAKSRQGSQSNLESAQSFHSARSQNDSESGHSFHSAVSYHNPPNAPNIGQNTLSLSQAMPDTQPSRSPSRPFWGDMIRREGSPENVIFGSQTYTPAEIEEFQKQAAKKANSWLPLAPVEGRKAITPLAFHQSKEDITTSSFLPLLPMENTNAAEHADATGNKDTAGTTDAAGTTNAAENTDAASTSKGQYEESTQNGN